MADIPNNIGNFDKGANIGGLKSGVRRQDLLKSAAQKNLSLFTSADKNGDGKVDVKDFANEKEYKKSIFNFGEDKNKDGKIDVKDFKSEEDYKKSKMYQVDTNKDGVITADEFLHAQSTEQNKIFDAIDKDKNDVIDENELNEFKKNLDENSDGKVKKGEINNFFKKLLGFENADKKVEDSDRNYALDFLQNYDELSQSIESTTKQTVDGKEVVTVKYKDGSIRTVNPDGSSVQTITDDGIEYVTSYDMYNQPTKSVYTDEQGIENTLNIVDGKWQSLNQKMPDGLTVYTYYVEGEPSVVKRTNVDGTIAYTTFLPDGSRMYESLEVPGGDNTTTWFKNDIPNYANVSHADGTTSRIQYENGVAVSRTHNLDEHNRITYAVALDGSELPIYMIENEGTPDQKETSYTYLENGVVVGTFVDSEKTVTKATLGEKTLSEIIIQKDGTNISKEYDENGGYRETVQNSDGSSSVAMFSPAGNIECKVYIDKKGKEYFLDYGLGTNGKPGAKVVVQYNINQGRTETVEELASKFGVSAKAIRKANGLRPGAQFTTGQVVIVPFKNGKIIEPNFRHVTNRKNSATVQANEAKYIQKQLEKEQRDALHAQLKDLYDFKNCYLPNGVRPPNKVINGQVCWFYGQCGTAERMIYTNAKGEFIVVAKNGTVLDESIVQGKIKFSRGKKITAKMRGGVTIEVVELQKIGKERKVVVDKNGSIYIMSWDNFLLDEEYLARDALADAVEGGDIKAGWNSIGAQQSAMADEARVMFEAQKKKDGGFAKFAEWISRAWSSDNTYSKTDADIKKFKNGIQQMQNLLDKGDEAGFKRVYQQTFGVPYNKTNFANAIRFPTKENFKKAFGNTNIMERVMDFCSSQDNGAAIVQGVAIVGTMFINPVAGTTMALATTMADTAFSEDKRAMLMDGDIGSWASFSGDIALDALPFGVGKFTKMAKAYKGTNAIIKNYNKGVNLVNNAIASGYIKGAKTYTKITGKTVKAKYTAIAYKTCGGSNAAGGAGEVLAQATVSNVASNAITNTTNILSGKDLSFNANTTIAMGRAGKFTKSFINGGKITNFTANIGTSYGSAFAANGANSLINGNEFNISNSLIDGTANIAGNNLGFGKSTAAKYSKQVFSELTNDEQKRLSSPQISVDVPQELISELRKNYNKIDDQNYIAQLKEKYGSEIVEICLQQFS